METQTPASAPPPPPSQPLDTLTFNHPSLGPLTGLHHSIAPLPHHPPSPTTRPISIAQFRSVPFATVPARFKQSVLCTSLPEEYDERPKGVFVEYGYHAPGREQMPEAYGGQVKGQGGRRYDEGRCLNLTVVAPKSVLDGEGGEMGEMGRKLPVMVYVHGGGGSEGGGHASALHDMSRVVALSVREGKPVVAVNITYRLNFFGFMACQDLIEEQRETGRQESPFNLGLWDSRNAFLWVKRHIAGFGGDPENVTAFGESFGGVIISYHLLTDVPLFRRAIMQSGHMGGQPQRPFWYHEDRYQSLLKKLNITGSTATDRLKALRAAPMEDIRQANLDLGYNVYTPYLGPGANWSPHPISVSTQASIIAANTWCKDLIIGDDYLEGAMWQYDLLSTPISIIVDRFRSVLGPSLADKLLQMYDIDPTDNGANNDANYFVQRAMVLASDLIFSEPTHLLCNALASSNNDRKIYRYQFCLTNPFPGSTYSYITGHHFIEIFFIFLTLVERFPKYRDHFYSRQAEETAKRWVAFANGEAPWAAYEPESGYKIAVCDDLRGWETRTREVDEEVSSLDPWGPRRYGLWEGVTGVVEERVREKMEKGEGGRNVVEEGVRLMMQWCLGIGEKFEGGEEDRSEVMMMMMLMMKGMKELMGARA